MTRMQPFVGVEGSIANHTVTTSIGSSTVPQYAESSCHGTRLPTPGGLQMKWLDHNAMSGPISASTRSSTSGAKSHSNSFGSVKCGTSIASGDLPPPSTVQSLSFCSKYDCNAANRASFNTGLL